MPPQARARPGCTKRPAQHRASCAACVASALPTPRPGFGAFTQPDVVRVPRARINIKLAVLCLRSSYEAVDDLNFTPMDGFQMAFWKRRAAEQEGYLALVSPLRVQQGDLVRALVMDIASLPACVDSRALSVSLCADRPAIL